MKYLKSYNESVESEKKDLIENVNDMLLELNDLGFKCEAKEPPTPRQSDIDLYHVYGYEIVKTREHIIVSFLKHREGFHFDEIEEVYYRIKDYLNENGYKDNGSLEKHFSQKEQGGKTILINAIFKKI